jgi:hypothetical protein
VISLDSEVIVFALPGNYDNSLTLIGGYLSEKTVYKILWMGDGFSGEPHLDVYTKGDRQIVSIFTRTEPGNADREVVVIDFEVDN